MCVQTKKFFLNILINYLINSNMIGFSKDVFKHFFFNFQIENKYFLRIGKFF